MLFLEQFVKRAENFGEVSYSSLTQEVSLVAPLRPLYCTHAVLYYG